MIEEGPVHRHKIEVSGADLVLIGLLVAMLVVYLIVLGISAT